MTDESQSNSSIVECPDCNTEYKRLGKHIGRSDCEYPELSTYQKELITGMLLGDAWMNYTDATRKPRMCVEMINREFLEWLDGELGVFSTGVSLRHTAEESYNSSLKSLDNNLNKDNFHNVYSLRTRRLDQLQPYADWYSSGKKRFPDNLQLTPTIAKMWYIGDGGVGIRDGRCEITSVNERGRGDYLNNLFDKVGFQTTFSSNSIRFKKDDSNDFLQWMGESVPGFEYKWELSDTDRYNKLKNRAYGDGAYNNRYEDSNWLDSGPQRVKLRA